MFVKLGHIIGLCLLVLIKDTVSEDQERVVSVRVAHILNAEEILKGGGEVKAKVRINGPFVYNIKVDKSNVVKNLDGTLSFVSKKIYQLDRKQSIAADDQALFTVPNVPYFNLVNSKVEPKVIEDLIVASRSHPFVLKHAQELLWGYEDPLLQLMKDRGLSKTAKFGLFADDQELSGSTFTVKATKESPDAYDQVLSIEGEKSFKRWGNDLCDKINGTDFLDGDARVHSEGHNPVHYLSSRLCRPFKFTFKANSTNEHGVNYLRYIPDDEFFGGVEKFSQNRCFCASSDSCPLPGTFDESKCKPGLVLSWPYFTFADKSISDKFDQDFQPRDKTLASVLEFDSSTGKVIKFNLGLQFNVQMKKVAGISRTENFTDILLPIVQTTDIIRPSLPGTNDGNSVDGRQPVAMALEAKDAVKKGIKAVVKHKINSKLNKKKHKGYKSGGVHHLLTPLTGILCSVFMTLIRFH